MRWLELLKKRFSVLLTMGVVLMTASASYGAPPVITVNTYDNSGLTTAPHRVYGSWSLDAGTTWNASGASASYAVSTAGSYTITFGDVPGYTKPASFDTDATLSGSGSYSVDAFGAAAVSTVSAAGYVATTNPGNPGLHAGQVNITVTITPAQAVTDGAAWSLDGGNVWYASGVTVSGPLSYTITFKAATADTGWRAPHSISGVTTALLAVTKTIPYPHIANDYDKTGKSKVLFRDAAVVSGGALYEWNMNGSTVTGGGYFSASPGLASVSPGDIVAQADFDGDGRTDLLFQDRTTRALTVWYMNGKTLSTSATLTIIPSATEIVAGVGDFDGDGKTDILLVDTAPGAVVTAALTPRILFMNGTTTPTSTATSLTIPQTTAAHYGAHTGWHVAAIADFDGDGKADILWRFANPAASGAWVAGQTSLWFMNGATRLSGSPLPSQLGAYQNTTSAVGIGAITGAVVSGAAPTGWLIVGTGDFNGDGYTDILYRYAGASNAAVTTGQISVWLMQGKSAAGVPVRIAGGTNTADYTAAGDLRGSGATVDTAGTALNAGAFTGTTGWYVVGVGDFNGDGKDDILWRYLGTGHTYVWTMNGRTVAASGFTTVYPGTNAAWSSQVMRSALDPQ